MPPMALMALPFDMVPLRVTVCFLGAIDVMAEAFLGRFWVKWEVNLECGLRSISMKVSICGGDFQLQVIRRSILTTSEHREVHTDKAQHTKRI